MVQYFRTGFLRFGGRVGLPPLKAPARSYADCEPAARECRRRGEAAIVEHAQRPPDRWLDSNVVLGKSRRNPIIFPGFGALGNSMMFEQAVERQKSRTGPVMNRKSAFMKAVPVLPRKELDDNAH